MVFQLFWLLISTRWWTRLGILVLSFVTTSLTISALFLQKEFLDQLTGTPSYLFEGYPWLSNFIPSQPAETLFVSFVLLLAGLICYQWMNFIGLSESIHFQKILDQKLYEKVLELRTDSLKGRSIGEIVSLYTVDVPGSVIFLDQSLPQFSSIIFPLIIAPIALHVILGANIWPTMLIVFALIGLNLFLAYRQSKFFYKFKQLAADRVGIVNEWIQNIRTLRILGWINAFEKMIYQARVLETNNRILMLNNGQTMNAISSSVTFFLNLSIIGTILWVQNIEITAGTLLALLWVVAIFLTRPFRQMPWFFTFVFDGWTSINRIAQFLELKNINSFERNTSYGKIKTISSLSPAIDVQNLNLTINNKDVLKNINFQMKQGEFTAVVGEVGSGKSLLLLSLLGETGANFSSYKIGENDAKYLPQSQLCQFFSFVPQEGFIMSASLRDNVAFD